MLRNIVFKPKQLSYCSLYKKIFYRAISTEIPFNQLSQSQQDQINEPPVIENVDVCIVGGGPSGLATAIKLKQLDLDDKLRVILLEKGSTIGSHNLSGVILEPDVWFELFPDSNYTLNDKRLPLPSNLVTPIKEEEFCFLTKSWRFPMPKPSDLVNKNRNFIGSLSEITSYLGEVAENMGIEIYPSVSVSDVVYDSDNNSIKGVKTRDLGISKNGSPKDTFEKGMEFHARQTVLAEGCHGSLTKKMIKKFDLRKDSMMQTYGLGIKELWEVKPENFRPGFVTHTMGFPLSNDLYGGGFQYHLRDNLVAVGLVMGLDYKNPYVSPYQEFQKMKHHPYYANVLKDGKCLEYGARALNEGGYQAIPKLNFPGGILVGATAGFMNVPKIKGSHNAVKSGILAAEEIFKNISKLPQIEDTENDIKLVDKPIDLQSYNTAVKNSSISKELYKVRNIRPSFNSPVGNILGMCYSGLDSLILKGHAPWTFPLHESDSSVTSLAKNYKPINYPKPDNKISFDIMMSVSRSGTYHDHDERCHLRVPDQDLDKFANNSYPQWKGIEQRFCPAGVYEFVEDENSTGKVKFSINSQNCVHCKTCDIKSPNQQIDWSVPEGGDGPKYSRL
ncbi:hypothetical protein TBLA_0F01620 [Henningerozyma blattae CBS 6284]|uniref:Electron transfer flavoprotein-ubiquinone oxidoreductase n=1 Tax=Henningerozyma blattae (strain ATCC 34711 / CBS 6284 / DSM 70876 / NBRC 10599 / NRRL Y-10934 / UCD 77-7) TaxID=1071380 RepID=I2H5Q2_HENB6|nr:hypothetical protein TBLA_0F01620 [Tetrapisispora blattae CBS 6284]CCH61704.1 hypothetical protein TBLA_0F01620 [Tetrapisispora blattae CBS 6284]